jgi:uncharacterized protein
MRCPYCYYGPAREDELKGLVSESINSPSAVMVDEVLESLVCETCVFNTEVAQFVWHGGEPLLAGKSFYEKAVSLEAEYTKPGQRIVNTIQTNATLLTESWASFFAEHQFNVGVSVDGPTALHDALRFFPGERGSFAQVMRGINYLRKAGVDFGVICTVNSANVQHANEIFSFFMSEGFHRFKFSHLHESERLGILREIAADPDAYADFIIVMFEEWIRHDDPQLYIGEASSILNLILGGPAQECIYAGECQNYFTVEYDGSVYPCDTVPGPRERWRFGNINDGIPVLLSSSAFAEFCGLFEAVKEATRGERWFPLLNTGCLGDYFPSIEKSQPTNTFAPAWQKIASHIQRRLEELGLAYAIQIKM